MQSTTDTEVILHLVARSHRNRFVDRFVEGLRMLEGSYAFVGLTNKKLDRRARPARHPAAGARQARRLSDPGVGNLRARHHRRATRARRRKRRSPHLRRGRRAFAQAVPGDARRGPASSNTSISRGRIRSFGGRSVYDVRKAMRRRAGPRGTRRRRRGRSGARFRRAGGDRLRPGVRHSLRARHHPQPLCRAHLHRADAAHPPARRAAQAQRQPRRGERQAHRADRRFDRARHDVGEDRADDARGRRPRSAFPHRLAADHASRLLRHRYAGARQAACRHARRSKPCANSSAPTRSPSSRSTASTAPWARRAAIRCARNSPTIASPANTRPRSPTARPKRHRHANSRCSPRRAEGCHGCLPTASRSSPAHRAASAARRRSLLAQAGAHVVAVARTQGGARRARRRDPRGRRHGDAGAARHARLSGRSYRLGRGAQRALSARSTCWSAMPRLSATLAARSRRAAELGRDHGGQRHRQLAPDPLHGSAARAPIAGRAVFITSGAATSSPRLCGCPIRSRRRRSTRWRAPMPPRRPTTPMRVDLFNPGPTRTRMRARPCRAKTR